MENVLNVLSEFNEMKLCKVLSEGWGKGIGCSVTPSMEKPFSGRYPTPLIDLDNITKLHSMNQKSFSILLFVNGAKL